MNYGNPMTPVIINLSPIHSLPLTPYDVHEAYVVQGAVFRIPIQGIQLSGTAE